MYLSAMHIRALHEAPDHSVSIPDVSGHSVRVVLDECVRCEADTSTDSNCHVTPVNEYSRRYTKSKREEFT